MSFSTQSSTVRDHNSDYEREKELENGPPASGQNEKSDNTSANSSPQENDPDFVARWNDNDPENPLNWTNARKCWITCQLGQLALVTVLGSSIISPAQKVIAAYTHISSEASVLCVSLYLLGFAFGPLIWGPISETWGRRWSMLPAVLCLSFFSIGVATSRNAQSILICRFFSGLCASSPVCNVSATLGDIWHPRVRGVAVSFYSVAVMGGPTIGPVIGAALTVNLNWRWTGYILAMWSAFIVAVTWFQLPETYAPYLLKKRAQHLRKEDSRWWHPHEHVKIDPESLLTKHFIRPLRMLATEPVVTALALYASFVYSLLYMTLEVFPIVFEQHRGWGPVVSTLPFLALFVGVCCALAINVGNQPRVVRAIDAHDGKAVPEVRLAPMAAGGFIFAIGLFWFGWTADPSIFWLSPVIAAAFIGCGFVIIFQQCINFMVDTYVVYAASAVAANTFLRSLLATGMPLAVAPMFGALGVGGAMSLLGGLAVLALPVPFVLMKYGVKLRQRSKFAPVDDS